jgi:hypothetical protein
MGVVVYYDLKHWYPIPFADFWSEILPLSHNFMFKKEQPFHKVYYLIEALIFSISSLWALFLA